MFLRIGKIFLLLFLFVLNVKAAEEFLLVSGNDKNPTVKSSGKRLEKFPISIDNIFDPTFWPSRGRRREQQQTADLNVANCDKNGKGEGCQDKSLLTPGQKWKMMENSFDLPLYSVSSADTLKYADHCFNFMQIFIPKVLDEGMPFEKLKIFHFLETLPQLLIEARKNRQFKQNYMDLENYSG